MRRRVTVSFVPLIGLVALVLLSLSACSATGAPNGGEDLFDAGPAPIPASMVDGGAVDSGSGITWTDLYRDFFGNVGATTPGCKGTGSCHGSADQGGGSTWVCGDTKDSCWKGLTTASPAIIDTQDPNSSTLLSVALRSKQGGNMPLSPTTYVFTDDAINRIRAWMAAGAQNN